MKTYNMDDKIYKTDEKNVIILQVEYVEVMKALHKLCFYDE